MTLVGVPFALLLTGHPEYLHGRPHTRTIVAAGEERRNCKCVCARVCVRVCVYACEQVMVVAAGETLCAYTRRFVHRHDFVQERALVRNIRFSFHCILIA